VEKGERTGDVEFEQLARVVTEHEYDVARAAFVHKEWEALARVSNHCLRLEDHRIVHENSIGFGDAKVVHQLAAMDGHDVISRDFAIGRDDVEDAERVVATLGHGPAHDGARLALISSLRKHVALTGRNV
jgi:hypothetical protein